MSKKPGGNPGGERRQLTEAERSDGRYDELQARVNAAYEAMRAANLNYFRLNIWGMAVCRDHPRPVHQAPPRFDRWSSPLLLRPVRGTAHPAPSIKEIRMTSTTDRPLHRLLIASPIVADPDNEFTLAGPWDEPSHWDWPEMVDPQTVFIADLGPRPTYDFESEDGLNLPMPGDVHDGNIVIASVWGTDSFDGGLGHDLSLATLMLLNPEPPFFSVVQIVARDDGLGWTDIIEFGREENIVHATRLYEQCGGDV